MAMLLSFHIFHVTWAQTTVKDIFRAGITILGVTKETGNVFSFVKVNNETLGRLFNATKEDLSNQDGIVETVISFPNETVATGGNFTACLVVLRDLSITCKSGFNVPERTDVIQFVLPASKKT